AYTTAIPILSLFLGLHAQQFLAFSSYEGKLLYDHLTLRKCAHGMWWKFPEKYPCKSFLELPCNIWILNRPRGNESKYGHMDVPGPLDKDGQPPERTAVSQAAILLIMVKNSLGTSICHGNRANCHSEDLTFIATGILLLLNLVFDHNPHFYTIVFWIFRAAPEAYGGSQARGLAISIHRDMDRNSIFCNSVCVILGLTWVPLNSLLSFEAVLWHMELLASKGLVGIAKSAERTLSRVLRGLYRGASSHLSHSPEVSSLNLGCLFYTSFSRATPMAYAEEAFESRQS
uniref:Uncharacterized protein n=1 Tax=Sus scrofa TaxID=9823 RepID=A0A8D0NLX5_PIG